MKKRRKGTHQTELGALLREAVERRASDIHLEPAPGGHRARLRVGDTLVDALAGATLPADAVQTLAKRAGLVRQPIDRPRLGALEETVAGRVVRFRASALPTAGGLLVSLHRPGELRSDLGALGILGRERLLLERTLLSPGGLVLFAGPSGSGKTTSLQTSLSWAAAQRRLVVSAEHPIEARLPGVHQVELEPDRGLDAEAVLPGLLLQDPDLIGFDEIRDWRTARAAVRAALAGTTAAATLAAPSSAAVVSRLLNFGTEPFLLTTTLRAAASQRLLPRLCSACRQPAAISNAEQVALEAPPQQHAFTAAGCSRCGGTGRQGRIAVYEVLELTPGIRELICNGASTAELHEEAVRLGQMTTLRRQALAYADLGEVAMADVLRLTPPDLTSLTGDPLNQLQGKLHLLSPEERERVNQWMEQRRQTRDGEVDALTSPP
jgi:type II secretory ATPase GspE/PulE/Tfp pilus assembly ATPase PilB-like protein